MKQNLVLNESEVNAKIESLIASASEKGRNDTIFTRKVKEVRVNVAGYLSFSDAKENTLEFAQGQIYARMIVNGLETLQKRINSVKKVNFNQLASVLVRESRDKKIAQKLAERQAIRETHARATALQASKVAKQSK
ncbi:MAG: hypothetical protein WA061_02130 [Microgenomates group bacterium]